MSRYSCSFCCSRSLWVTFFSLGFISLLSGFECEAKFVGQNMMDDEVRREFVLAHNEYRSIDAADASEMLEVVWDYHLEAYAFWYTSQVLCDGRGTFDHSPSSPQQGKPWRPAPGENLYAAFPGCSDTHSCKNKARDAVRSWWEEKKLYEWDKSPDWYTAIFHKIGHYTQVVRANTGALGCAVVSDCPLPQDNPPGVYVNCQYDEGNLGLIPYNNIRFEKNSEYKRSCSKCPAGYNCCGHDSPDNIMTNTHLCVGYPVSAGGEHHIPFVYPWPEKKTSDKPPTDLADHSPLACWPFAVRPPVANGGCGPGATLREITETPKFMIQQCICDGFDFEVKDGVVNHSLESGLFFRGGRCISKNGDMTG